MNRPEAKAEMVFKACGCGRSYTRDQWHRLALVGIQLVDDEMGPLELRNCPCGSTHAVDIGDRHEEESK